MALQHSSLGPTQYVPPTPGAVYTNPGSTKTYIRGMLFFNANQAAVEQLRVYNVAVAGGTVAAAGTQNQLMAPPLQPNSSLLVEFPGPGIVLMNQNDSIQASTTTYARVTCTLFGDYDA